jgi:hypothetical protein
VNHSGSVTNSPANSLHPNDSRVRGTIRLAVYLQSVRLGPKPLENTTSILFFHLNTCGYSPYVTSSLTRGWVCSLQLLLALASAVILGSDSRGTHDLILLSQIRDSHNLEGQVLVFISPRNRVTQLNPQALGSLSVAYYFSQGYGEGIRTRLHTWFHSTDLSNCSAYYISARTA